MDGKYLNNWGSKEDMTADFEEVYGATDLTPEHIAKYSHVDVLLASYGTGNYSGDAFVLFRNAIDGQLYEINGGHCSCYGLEGQWDEEPCDLESLKHRVINGNLGSDDYNYNIFKDEILQVIEELEVSK